MPSLYETLHRIVHQLPEDKHCFTSPVKSYVSACLIRWNRIQCAAEIGVYKGSFLFPVATAMRYSGGMMYGIDPYLNDCAVQEDGSEAEKAFLKESLQTIDFEAIHDTVLQLREKFGMQHDVCIMRMTSEKAAAYFKENQIRLQFLHIDGNHDTQWVTDDVQRYLPLMRKGGIIVVDDVAWNSVKPALEVLRQNARMVFLQRHPNREKWGDYAIFVVRPWPGQALLVSLQVQLARLSERVSKALTPRKNYLPEQKIKSATMRLEPATH